MHIRTLALFSLSLSTISSGCGSRAASSQVKDTTDATLFSSRTPIAFEIRAGFADPFTAARAGEPDGIFPRPRVKDPFAGSLVFNGQQVETELKVRGNSSLQECYFPKISVKFTGVIPAGFEGTKKFKLGTHCGDEERVNGRIGRLRHERATWREAAAYELAAATGLESLKVRPAQITYLDSSPGGMGNLTRKAFVLEHIDALAKRVGGVAIEDPETYAGDPSPLMDAAVVVKIALFHALIGNWDWHVGSPEERGHGGFWNTEAVTLANGRILPIPADFDLSTWVTADLGRAMRQPDTSPTPENYRKLIALYLEEGLRGKDPAVITQVKADLLSRKEALRQVAATAPLDDEGRANAQAHVEAFLELIAR